MPISVPPYMPMRQEVRPNIDIAGSISGLGDALQQGMEFGQKRRVDKATRAALASGLTTGPDGLPDYMAAAGNILAGGGDTETALTLARLAEAQNQRLWQQNQPDWQTFDGNLYNFNSPSFRQAATGRQSPQPQADPADFGNPQQPPAPDQPAPDYQPPAPDQPAPDYQPPAPDQQADAGRPAPTLQGRKKPPQRRTGIDAQGRTVTEEAGEDGVWRVVSGPKAAEPKPPTEDQNKSRQLLTTSVPQLAILDTTFDALTDPDNQWAASLTPEKWRNYTVTEDYQRARMALARIFIAYTYSVSGAQISEGEALRQTEVMLPALGEGKQTILDKKAYIHTMVDSIRERGNTPGSFENAAPADPQQQAKPPPSNKPPVAGAIWSPDDGRWFIIGPDGQPDWVP